MLSIMKMIRSSNSIKNSLTVKLLKNLLLMAAVFSAQADDTEIFYTTSEVNSNVLFIMDNSGSMRETVDGTYTTVDVEVTSSIASDEDDAEEYVVEEDSGTGDSDNSTHAITDYLEMTRTDSVSNTWKSLVLTNTYTNPVVACTYNIPSGSDNEGSVRVQIISGDIQIKVQRPLNSNAVTASSVYCTVSEEGSYTTPIKYEAHTVTSTQTNKKYQWQVNKTVNVTASKVQNYSNPVITGQVMSYNNPNYVTFWSSRCSKSANPATNAEICVGKHTGESPNNGVTTETLGYFIAEAATYTLDSAFVKIALGPDSIRGIDDSLRSYSLPRSYTYATATISAMDGQDGGWAVLYGETPVSDQLNLAIDEDRIGDSERNHTTEQVAYWVMAPNDANGNGSLSNNTNVYSSDIEMIQEDGEQVVGFRFTNIDVPKDAVISSAYIQFTADSDAGDTSSDVSSLNIKIQQHDNPPTFVNGAEANIADRTLYSETVDWSPPAWDSAGAQNDAQKTPELKSLIQLVVNRGGWSEGNAAVFVIAGSGKRSAQSYDHDNGLGAAVLHVSYETEGQEKTRMQVMKDALRIVLAEAPNNLSVGIMNYGGSTGWRRNHPNGVKFPVKAITKLARPIVEKSIEIDGVPNWALNNIPEPNETVDVRTFLSEIADSWESKGMTPIVDALYEATLYYRGDPLWRGFRKATEKMAAHPATYAQEGPPLVEAIDNLYNSGACDAAPHNKAIWGLDSIDEWRSGDTWGYKCPADPANPSNGSAANCAATENSCDLNQKICNSGWVGGRTDYNDCTGEDEDGNPTGCQWYPAHCPDDDWGPVGSNSFCKYKVCKDAKMDPPEYISPAISDCQSNNIILMSDGKPEYLTDRRPYANGVIESLIGTQCVDSPNEFKAGRCGPELTRYIADNDINSGLDGDQTVNTFVVGFASGISENAALYLESLVTVEDNPESERREGYFSAQNEEELASAFAQALDEIAQKARSQASPGYSVNVKSGLEHEDDIYIPVFDRGRGAVWSGNLKKFKLVDDDGHRYIRGKVTVAGDDNADGYINAMTELGLFKDDAWDEFSEHTIPDGNAVKFGGTASLLTNPAVRNLYTNVGTSNNLSHDSNELNLDNTINLTSAKLFDATEMNMTESAAEDYREKLINYIRGWLGGYYDPDAELGPGLYSSEEYDGEGVRPNRARWHMGDMLHSAPVVITYAPATEDEPKKQYIFAATNEGYLHAFDSTTGMERFAFMPEEFLKNVEHQFINEGEHRYGIDGSISYHHNDDNDDGIVNGEEKVLLFFGLRRGGRAYYALDVTDMGEAPEGDGSAEGTKPQPKLLWRIDENTSGFGRLGQSWSMPYIAKVKVDGTPTAVVVFTGGNDVVQDYGEGETYTESSVTSDMSDEITMGDDIYIVNAETGSLLWNMRDDVTDNGTDVSHPIPGGARILDVNRNGLLDRMYFADTGGNVWRLDLDEGLGNGSKLTKFASLGGTGEDARKFYNEPDVAMMRGNGKTLFSVSVGSGLRPHPMNEFIKDSMFILLDKSPFAELPDNFPAITIVGDTDNLGGSGLARVTITDEKAVNQTSDFEGKKITQTGKDGWYVAFDQPGEKILASSITFEGSILFTTLVPQAVNLEDNTPELISSCALPATQGRLYALNILTGEPSMNLDNSEDTDPNDADVYTPISVSEIPGTPQTVFNSLDCTGGSCTHDVDVRIGKKSSEAGTENVADVESIYWNSPEQR